MKKTLVFSLLVFISTTLFSQNIVGVWKTIDDVSKEAKSYVTIKEKNGKYFGYVTKILDEKKANNTCTVCTDDRKNKKIVGMEIIRGLEKDGSRYEDGTILDPDNGKVYSCYLELNSKNKLKVRGYIGFAAIGRTQYWYRVE